MPEPVKIIISGALSFATLGCGLILLIWIRDVDRGWRRELCFSGRPDLIDHRLRRIAVLAARLVALMLVLLALYVVWV